MKLYQSLYSSTAKISNESISEIIEKAKKIYEKTKNTKEFVYFASSNSFVKIGRTNNWIKRKSQLQNNQLHDVRLLGIVFPYIQDTCVKLENDIHRCYDIRCMQRELFRLNDFDIISKADVLFSDYFYYRYINETEYYDIYNKKYIKLKELVCPILMWIRLNNTFSRKTFADDCIVGMDEENCLYAIDFDNGICAKFDSIENDSLDIRIKYTQIMFAKKYHLNESDVHKILSQEKVKKICCIRRKYDVNDSFFNAEYIEQFTF